MSNRGRPHRDGRTREPATAGPATTYLYGPPGFGVDEYAGDWVAAEFRGRPVLWFDVPSDLDAAVVERRLHEEVERLRSAGSSADLVVVVSGVQNSTALDERLIAGRAGIVSGTHLVLVSDRRPSAWPGGQLGHVLGPDDMVVPRAVSHDDLAAAAPDAAPETIDAVIRASGGWPALVTAGVMCLTADGSDADAAMLEMRAILARDLVPWLPERWVAVLRHLVAAGPSQMRELDAIGSADTPVVLGEMRELGIVTVVSTGGQSLVTLFPALQRVLHDRARSLGPKELTSLYRGAALVRLRLGALDCGLRAAHLARDWSLCGVIIDRWWPHIVFRGHRALAQRAVMDMPHAVLVDQPGAGHYAEQLGALPLGTTVLEVPELARSRARGTAGADEVVTLNRMILAMLSRRSHGHAGAAQEIAETAVPWVQASVRGVHSRAAGVVSLWHLHAGLSCHLAGDAEQARRFYHHAWRMREYDVFGFLARDAASKLAVHAALSGESSQVRRWLSEASKQPRAVDFVEDYIERGLQLAEFVVDSEALALDAAAPVPTRIRDMYARDEFWPFVLWARARHEMTHGRAREVLRMVDDAEALFSGTSTSGGIAHHICVALRVDARLALGHGTQAERAAGAVRGGQLFDRAVTARLRLLGGDNAGAIDFSRENRQGRDISEREQLELLLIEATAHWRDGDEAIAAERIAEAVQACDRTGNVRAFATVPRELLSDVSRHVPAVEPLVTMLDERQVGVIYPDRVTLHNLTDRERAVLHGIATGATIGDLAGQFFVTRNTLKSQLRSLYAKLDVHSRDEAVTVAGSMGLLDVP